MVCMWEHIDGLYGGDAILHIEQLQVARLCGGIAAYVNNTLRLCKQDDVDYILVHAGTRRVGDDDIGTAVLVDEILCQHILHVACKEEGVGDAIDLRIYFGVFDGFGYILDADDLACLA